MPLLGLITCDNWSLLLKPINILCISISVIIIAAFALSWDYISLLVIFSSFIFGAVGSHFLLSSKDFPVNSIPQFMEWKRQALPGIRHSKRCAVCGNRKCKRHRPELSVQVLKPWTGLIIPDNVDRVIEEIFNLTLQTYVLPWYNDQISKDEAFILELKVSVRYLLATLVKRVQQVDLVALLTSTLAKALLQHADECLCAAKAVSSHTEGEMLKKMARNLHRSMKSRKSELEYLHGIMEKLLPYLVPRKYLQSKCAGSLVREVFCASVLLPAMDIIANPEIINEFLILFFDRTPMIQYEESQEPKVELLHNFETGSTVPSRSVLYTDLQTIMSHQQLLFPFMQFLKEEAAVNVLQFCLGVDDFNKRILNPDLTNEQLISLHKEVTEMYNTYFAYGAVDRINFEDQVVVEMKRVVEGDPTNVIILRTTTTLFKAYDYAYSQLEDIYCPLFHQSSRYFSLLCGDRLNNSGNRSLWSCPGTLFNRAKRPVEQSTMSKISSKIKGVFVTNVDNGRMYEEEAGLELGEGVFTDSLLHDAHPDDEDFRLKNLSAWRISIPRIETLMDLNCKYYDAFVIEVKRIDIRDDDKPEDLHWTVQRRYNEFYVLAAKLSEFHGENLEINLPPKRSFGNKGRQFLESRRPIFEKFLTDLLAVPSLKGSELLYKFLKSPVEFTTNFLPEINFGKMIKTVPMKLIKEKGQHLLPFLQNFVASTEAAKPKPSKMDWKDIYELPVPEATEKLQKTIFKDNSGNFKISSENPEQMGTCPTLDGIYDYILYLAAHVFKLPEYYLRIILTFEIPLRQIIQAYTEWYLDLKLNQALHPIRIQTLLENFRDVLFFDQTPPKTDSEKMKVRLAALKATIDFFPDWLAKAVGVDKFASGIETLFMILQNPRLNKQLSYRLLDIVVLELFPELRDDTPSPL